MHTLIQPAPSGVRVTREAVSAVIKEYGAIIARNAKLPLQAGTAKDKHNLALEAAEIFATEIEGNRIIQGMPLDDALRAADFTDPASNLGLLSGTLALQTALSRMQYEYPQINSVFTDFSSGPGLYKQTEVSRIVLTPAVQSFTGGTDSGGRPLAFTNVSPAQTVDVPITLDEYIAVPIVFGNTTLASTARNLFGEIANQALYAIGGYFVQKLLKLFTAANYNAYAATTAAGGATTSGSQAITVTSTAGMYPGQLISGTGIPANAFVLAVTSATTANLNYPATSTNAGPLTFVLGSTPTKVPQTYTTFPVAKANMTMNTLGIIGSAFDQNEVPQMDRAIMLNAGYYQQLSFDPSFNTFFAALRNPQIITKGTLPELQGFTPMKAPFFPSDNYRVGFAYHKAAAVLKSRLPMDVTQALGVPVPGSVSTITEPSTGMSIALVQHVSLTGMYAEWRPEIMLGAAVGERRAGLVLTSQ